MFSFSLSRRIAAGAFAVTLSLPAAAALPQPGMWSIGSELNGKPGRGIQVDSQGGNFVILTYFGYRADGSATFFQASGEIKDGKTFTGQLTEFKNGRTLGGAARDGEVAAAAGPIEVTFDTTTSGTISLPGEGTQAFARFPFDNTRMRLNHTFAVATFSTYAYVNSSHMTISVGENTLTIDHSFPIAAGGCQYTGNIVQTGAGFRSEGDVVCTDAPEARRYRIEDLKVSEFGILTGRIHVEIPSYPNAFTDITGVCMSRRPVFMAPQRCTPTELGLQ